MVKSKELQGEDTDYIKQLLESLNDIRSNERQETFEESLPKIDFAKFDGGESKLCILDYDIEDTLRILNSVCVSYIQKFLLKGNSKPIEEELYDELWSLINNCASLEDNMPKDKTFNKGKLKRVKGLRGKLEAATKEEKANIKELLLMRFTDIAQIKKDEVDEDSIETISVIDDTSAEQNMYQFHQTLFEKDSYKSLSLRVKLFLATITQPKIINGEINTDMFGNAQMENIYISYDCLLHVLTNCNSNITDIIQMLKMYAEDKSLDERKRNIYRQLANFLVTTERTENELYMDENTINKLLFNGVCYKTFMYKAYYREYTTKVVGMDGIPEYVNNVSLAVVDANQKLPESLLLNKALQRFNNLSYIVDGNQVFNYKIDLFKNAIFAFENKSLTKSPNRFAFVHDDEMVFREKTKNLFEILGIDIPVDDVVWESEDFSNEKIPTFIERAYQVIHRNNNPKHGQPYVNLMHSLTKELKEIFKIYNHSHGVEIPKSIKIGSKTVSGTVQTTMMYDQMRKFRTKERRDQLKKMWHSCNNYLLDFHYSILETLSVDFVSLEALASSEKSNTYKNIGELSYLDNLITELAFYNARFAGSDRDLMHEHNRFSLQFSKGKAFTFAISDKNRMLAFDTLFANVLYKSKDGNKEIIENLVYVNVDPVDGKYKITLHPALMHFVEDQLFRSEAYRIYKTLKSKDSINSGSVANAGTIFWTLPMFNLLKTAENKNILEAIKDIQEDNLTMKQFLSKLNVPEQYVERVITKSFQSMIDEAIQIKNNNGKLEISGVYADHGLVEVNKNGLLDYSSLPTKTMKRYESAQVLYLGKYISSHGKEKKVNALLTYVTEFFINSIIQKQTQLDLFCGGISQFAKDKSINPIEYKDGKEKLSESYISAYNSLSAAIQKRAAMFIAPGSKFANSEQNINGNNSMYMLEVAGKPTMSKYYFDYLRIYYPNVPEYEIEEIKNKIDALQTDPDGLKKYKNSLAKKYPNISGFLSIDELDGQMFCTYREYYRMLRDKGAITQAQMDELIEYTKNYDGTKNENLSKDLTKILGYDFFKDFVLSDEDKKKYGEELLDDIAAFKRENNIGDVNLWMAFNPLKTLYTGTNVHNGYEVLTYAKASVMPLMPWTTKGLEIDKLRTQMEAIEERLGKDAYLTVAMDSAIKVGQFSSKSISIEDLYNATDLSSFVSFATKMDRGNYRLQQETESHLTHNYAKNKITQVIVGSQIAAMKFANGIAQNNDKIFSVEAFKSGDVYTIIDEYNNSVYAEDRIKIVDGKISGVELNKLDIFIHQKLSDKLLQDLLKELNIKDLKNIKVTSALVKQIYSIIKKEVIRRGETDSDILKQIDIREDGDFEFPLWATPNAVRIQQLIMSIFTNRLAKLKVKGNSHILGSSYKMTKMTDERLFTHNKKIAKGIIWVGSKIANKDTRDVLKPNTIENGKLNRAKILISSQFSYTDKNGHLQEVDLYEKNDDGEFIYITQDENGKLFLKEDMIDPAMLDMFGYRIPTSSQAFATSFEIVGILPKEAGDLVVFSKEYMILAGEDFNINKRYFFKYNNVIDENGKIIRVSSDMSQNKHDKHYLEYLQNCLVGVYNSIYQTDDLETQKILNEQLSIDIESNTADNIEKLENSNIEGHKIPNILSPEVQRKKIRNGADSLTAVSIYALLVKFFSLYQRSGGVLVQDIKKFDSSDKFQSAPFYFGKRKINSKLGNLYTELKDGDPEHIKRRNTSVLNADFNIAVDNIKGLIMDRTNENPVTIPAKAMLHMLGVDLEIINGETQSVVSYYLSQDILKDYASKNVTSVIKGKNYHRIMSEIFTKYGIKFDSKHRINYEGAAIDILWGNLLDELNTGNFPEFTAKITDANSESINYQWSIIYQILCEELLDGNNLYAVKRDGESHKYYKLTQIITMLNFFHLNKFSGMLTKFNTTLNVASRGVGETVFDMVNNYSTLSDMLNSKYFPNYHSIVFKRDESGRYDGIFLKIKNGYREVSVSPTSTEGVIFLNSVYSARKILEPFYHVEAFKYTYNTLKDLLKTDKNFTRTFFSEFNNFIYTIFGAGFYNNNNSVTNESIKRLLYLASENSDSLGSFLNHAIENCGMLKHSFLSKLDISQNEDGFIIIKNTEDLKDKDYKKKVHLEIKRFLQDDTPIYDDNLNKIDFNGEDITYSQLMQLLLLYAYIANTEKNAISIRDIVSIEYLTEIGLSKRMRQLDNAKSLMDLMKRFEVQYIQHHYKDLKEGKYNYLSTEELRGDFQAESVNGVPLMKLTPLANRAKYKNGEIAEPYIIVTCFNKGRKSTWLYQKIGFTYYMISKLDSFGVNQYDANTDIVVDIKTPQKQRDAQIESYNNVTGIDRTNILKIQNINTIGDLKNFYHELTDISEFSNFLFNCAITKGIKIKFDEEFEKIAAYDKTTNTILFGSKILQKTKSEIVSIITEELVHSLTTDLISKFVKDEKGSLTVNRNLVRQYLEDNITDRKLVNEAFKRIVLSLESLIIH